MSANATQEDTTHQKSIIWIDWGRHLRSQTLARCLGVDLAEIQIGGARLKRYALSTLQTFKLLLNKKPRIVIATNPSIFLGLLLLLARTLLNFRLVSDAHNFGVRSFNGNRILQRILDFHNRSADLVIVTNEPQKKLIEKLGGKAFVCQDPLPELPPSKGKLAELPPKSIFFICSFDLDEPYEAAFQALENLQDEGFRMYVSGNFRKTTINPTQFPWVTFLGFVSDQDFYAYLRSASVIMDLTTMEDCLVCGAYEALAAHKPLVISHTKALQEYFGEATVLTENTSEQIRENLRLAYDRRDELSAEARDWCIRNEPFMLRKISRLTRVFESW